MANIKFAGPLKFRLRSFAALNRIMITTYLRHAFGKRVAPDWDAHLEVGIRFWRHQFTTAMHMDDIAQGRLLFDSVQTETDDVYDVSIEPAPGGLWYVPKCQTNKTTLLYLHGGGYTFHGAMSRRFAAMLAHHCAARLYAPEYRLTPEHPHPAQADDALAAWTYVTANRAAKDIIVVGDSAGGHMALMLLQSLKAAALEQPALCIGLCPWTDIGDRGTSLHGNDPFDLVQGWMAVQFGKWLDPKGTYGRAALSPIAHDYAGLAPMYLQAGGREILHDMIVDFADVQKTNGADVTLDVWPDMPHDFQAYDTLKTSSSQALKAIVAQVQRYSAS